MPGTEVKAFTRDGLAKLKAVGGVRTEHREAKTPGLRLIVQPSGAKSWAFRYVNANRQDRKLTLGDFEALTLDEARTAASNARADVQANRDPAAAKAEGRDPTNTVEAVWHDYNRRHLGDPAEPLTDEEQAVFERDGVRPLPQVGEDTAKATRSFFERLVLPAWGNRAMNSITVDDVKDVLQPLKPYKDAQRKAKTRLHHFFKWAINEKSSKVIAANPVAGITTATAPGRARQLDAKQDELRAVWNAAVTMAYPFGHLVRMLTLTLARRTEIAALRWDEVGEALITIPGERTKNGIPLDIHITPEMKAILDSVPNVDGATYVFSTDGGKTHVSGFSKFKARIDALIGDAVAPWTLHDLRRTGSTMMQRLGIRKEVIDACQNHKMAGVSADYLRYGYAPEKVLAFEAVSTEARRIADNRAPVSNVVALRA